MMNLLLIILILIFCANSAWSSWLDHRVRVSETQARIDMSRLELEKLALAIGSS